MVIRLPPALPRSEGRLVIAVEVKFGVKVRQQSGLGHELRESFKEFP